MNDKKNNFKILLVIIISLFVISLLMFCLYSYFKYWNNQWCDEILSTYELTFYGEHDELINKAMLYYDLGIVSKIIGYCTFSLDIILSAVFVYKKHKESKQISK